MDGLWLVALTLALWLAALVALVRWLARVKRDRDRELKG